MEREREREGQGRGKREERESREREQREERETDSQWPNIRSSSLKKRSNLSQCEQETRPGYTLVLLAVSHLGFSQFWPGYFLFWSLVSGLLLATFNYWRNSAWKSLENLAKNKQWNVFQTLGILLMRQRFKAEGLPGQRWRQKWEVSKEQDWS